MSSEISMNGVRTSLADARGTRVTENLRNAEAGKNSGRVDKAARDFEAVLLGKWLEQAEQSFATVPGDDPNNNEDADPGRDQFHSLALQAVASSISGHGKGLGIAAMISKHLGAAERASQAPEANHMELKGLGSTNRVLGSLPTGGHAKDPNK